MYTDDKNFTIECYSLSRAARDAIYIYIYLDSTIWKWYFFLKKDKGRFHETRLIAAEEHDPNPCFFFILFVFHKLMVRRYCM